MDQKLPDIMDLNIVEEFKKVFKRKEPPRTKARYYICAIIDVGTELGDSSEQELTNVLDVIREVGAAEIVAVDGI